MHPYFLEQHARSHVDRLHRTASAGRRPEQPLRVRVGEALVHLGRRVSGPTATPVRARTLSPCA